MQTSSCRCARPDRPAGRREVRSPHFSWLCCCWARTWLSCSPRRRARCRLADTYFSVLIEALFERAFQFGALCTYFLDLFSTVLVRTGSCFGTAARRLGCNPMTAASWRSQCPSRGPGGSVLPRFRPHAATPLVAPRRASVQSRVLQQLLRSFASRGPACTESSTKVRSSEDGAR